MAMPASFGSYEVDHLIGSGSFADVFLCYHAGLETKVAVKVLHPHLARDAEVCDRFMQEAQVLWRADSDRVIQVTHVDQLDDGRPYFVMRYADRGSLDRLMQEQAEQTGAPFSLRETVGLGVEMADCLDAIKARNVVHRDLKPMNILVKTIRTPDHRRAELFGLPASERLVLADFGLAKRLREGTNFASQLGGTPAYMAPEQASLTAAVTWRADLFAVAVIVYEIATGAVPWPTRNLAQVVDVDLGEVAIQEWRPDFPAELDDILHRALSPDPMDRYDDPEDFADALLGLLGDEPSPAAGRGPVAAVRVLCEDVRTDSSDVLMASAVTSIEQRLDEPVRIGVVGGNRLSPVPLGLKLVGERPPPGEASLLGSVVLRLGHGEPALVATLHGGERVAGNWHKDDRGFLHLDLPAAAWTVESLELSFPVGEMEDLEIIDVPHGAMKRNRELVRAVYDQLDVVVVGVPAERSAERAAIDEVLSLGGGGLGPFAALGVRQLGVSTEADHPALLGTAPGDDTIELRVLLDEVLAGRRREECRASAAWSRLHDLVLEAEQAPVWAPRVRAVAEEFPELRELHVLREDLSSSRLDSGTRRRLHRVLGRRMAAARLGVMADAPLELLVSHAVDEQRAWQRSDSVAPEIAEMMSESLTRLERSLRARMEGATT